MRLQKYLAECGIASRRAAEKLIAEGKVFVDGKRITEMGFVITPDSKVLVSKKFIRPIEKGVIILNKPRGVVTTKDDPQGRAKVTDFLPRNFQSYFPVGRLDYDSSGLVIMTNDGDLAERLLHPRHKFQRVYEVIVKGDIKPSIVEKIRKGIRLEDGIVKAEVVVLGKNERESKLKVTISIGRNRIIRRMFEKLRFWVKKLHRIKHGPFVLGKLPAGHLRILSNTEYKKLREKCFDDLDRKSN